MTEQARWVFLSPHLDDAVLSCGALIAELATSQRVDIWSIFTRAPLKGPYSDTARWLHSVSGGKSGARLASQRRTEDKKASAMLGASVVHIGFTEAAYRKRADGRFLYRDSLQGSVHPEDAKLIERVGAYLRDRLQPNDFVVAPLGIGGHADHMVTREAARQCGSDLLYYAEIPYLESRLEAVNYATQAMWQLNFGVTAQRLEEWLRSTEAYRSQLPMFRDQDGGVTAVIARYARSSKFTLFSSNEALARRLERSRIFSLQPPTRPDSKPRSQNLFSDQAAFPSWSDRPLAPIAIFAFNRLDTLKRTISALEQCDGFADSRIHVFCDAARENRLAERERTERVQAWLAGWCSNSGAQMHVTKHNLGLRTSIVNGVADTLANNESVIVLEDDIITSPSFLVFMNQALQVYQDRDDIMQVSGYFVPHSTRVPPIGLLRAPGSWGWATWRRAWAHYSDDAKSLLEEIKTLDRNAFDMNGSYAYFDSLKQNAQGTLDTWTVRWYASMFCRGGLAVYPSKSFTRNIGFGDDGTNCKPGPMARIYNRQRIRHRPISPRWQAIGSSETPGFAQALEAFYRWQNRQWTKTSVKDRIRGSVARLRTGNAPA